MADEKKKETGAAKAPRSTKGIKKPLFVGIKVKDEQGNVIALKKTQVTFVYMTRNAATAMEKMEALLGFLTSNRRVLLLVINLIKVLLIPVPNTIGLL